MKSAIVALASAGFIATVMVVFGPAAARAQGPEVVEDEIARVNNEIITRNEYLSALKDFKEQLGRQMPAKSQAEVDAEFERLKPTVLDQMIDDLLLEQRARELNIDVEAEVNQQLAGFERNLGDSDAPELDQRLIENGIDPDADRSLLRRNLERQGVIKQEVVIPIYESITEEEKRAFYESHKRAFVTPGEILLSEIFLPFENLTPDEVAQRAERLVVELKAGADFEEAALNNSPPTRASHMQNGKMGSFVLDDLRPDVKAALNNLNPGDFTDPSRLPDGYQIIRLDERKPPVMHEFEEPEVQRSITTEIVLQRAPLAQKNYMNDLRRHSRIYVKPGYAPAPAAPPEASPALDSKK